MPSKGRDHFREYDPRTAVKHTILDKYFRAYITALRGTVEAFHYIDGFAGEGRYGSDWAGSPVIALAALSASARVATVTFVESNRESFEILEKTLDGRLDWLDAPLLKHAQFADVVSDVIERPIYRQHHRVGTFAFIDPCGAKGVRLSDIGRLLDLPFAECLLFWNYDGINRWIGAVERGTHAPDELAEFFGGNDVLHSARECFRSRADKGRKEAELLGLYITALRDRAHARFVVPFRFQAKGKERTSHYLIHCSNHPVAFKIMKEVMWSLTTEGSEAGAFAFLDERQGHGQALLLDPAIDRARAAVLEELTNGPRTVGQFTADWVLQPNDFLVERQYKDILRRLEAEDLIEVVDQKSGQIKPPSRRLRSGAVTLGADLLVRLKSLI